MSVKFGMATAAVALVLVVLIVVNAPPPEGAAAGLGGSRVPIATVFRLLERENDAVRALWTERIVGAGKRQGLSFDKHWHDESVEAGPLPALFLRETAESLRRNRAPLLLFLGAEFPINDANRFAGVQAEHFQEMQRTGAPAFFFDDDIDHHTAMFSDVAVAAACVDCHNNEPESPKKDWALGDVMGATTWAYPRGEVSLEEALAMLGALRQAFREAYAAYIAKAAAFARPPTVGERWPEDGYFLPSVDRFTEEARRRTSPATLQALLHFRRIRS